MPEVVTPDQAVNITAITQLIVRERESRDLCLWNRMANCFFDDSRVEISWFQGSGKAFVEASKGMYERGMRASHRLGPVLVSLNRSRAVATLSAIIDVPQELDGVALTLSSHCLMVYKSEKRQGAWGLVSFSGIYRRDELIPEMPGTSVNIPPDDFKDYRPSYRNLSWCLARTGYEVNNELPGADRPETVTAMIEEAFAWAGLPAPG